MAGPSAKGLDNNRYGDLCDNCRNDRYIPREDGNGYTHISTDQRHIRGPALYEAIHVEHDVGRQYSSTFRKPTLAHVDKSDIFRLPGKVKLNVDHVPAIKCPVWPSVALEFVHRPRPHGWPTPETIAEIVSQGCHLVARGWERQPETKMRQYTGAMLFNDNRIHWQLSFAIAEQTLIKTLTPPQIKCYLLAKSVIYMIQKDMMYERQPYDPESKFTLTSYILKTTFFWVLEEIPPDDWTDDNLGHCFMFLLRKLASFLERRYIPGYFIPTVNVLVLRETCDHVDVTSVMLSLYQDLLILSAGSVMLKLYRALETVGCGNLWLDWPKLKATFDPVLTTSSGGCLFGGLPFCNVTLNFHTLDRLRKLLALHFANIARSLYTHGNYYGKGINSSRAEFYEKEAAKLGLRNIWHVPSQLLFWRTQGRRMKIARSNYVLEVVCPIQAPVRDRIRQDGLVDYRPGRSYSSRRTLVRRVRPGLYCYVQGSDGRMRRQFIRKDNALKQKSAKNEK